MFEFAISRNKKRRPTRRIIASWIASFFAHLLLLALLIQFPEVLRGGRYHDFRPLSLIANLVSPQPKNDDDKWRTVTIVSNRMEAPSVATLKKHIFDFKKKEGMGAPPVRIRWGDEQKEALKENAPPARIKIEPKQSEPAPVGNVAASTPPPVVAPPPTPSPATSAGQAGPASGRNAMNLPPPAPPAPKTDVAANRPPSTIPDPPKPAVPREPKEPVKVFEDEQKAIRSQGSGFFDTKDFPLGEYANLIKERIERKWFIPSNLRNSRGQTTIVFYIGKDGRYRDCRIVTPSGNTSLDLAALKAVMDSNPFPPLPKGFPGEHIGAKFVLSYNEPQ